MDGNWEQMVPRFFQCYDSGALRFSSVMSEVGIGTTQAEQLPKGRGPGQKRSFRSIKDEPRTQD